MHYWCVLFPSQWSRSWIRLWRNSDWVPPWLSPQYWREQRISIIYNTECSTGYQCSLQGLCHVWMNVLMGVAYTCSLNNKQPNAWCILNDWRNDLAYSLSTYVSRLLMTVTGIRDSAIHSAVNMARDRLSSSENAFRNLRIFNISSLRGFWRYLYRCIASLTKSYRKVRPKHKL